MKALRAPILLPALAFLLLATPRLSASCVLREGQGADFGRIGVTTEESVGAVPRDVNMLYESGVLSQIFVYGGDCRTSKGIGIGDAQGEVERAYGRGKKSVHSLEKGKGDRIGQMGDYFLEYSGVTFVIAEEKVVAFIIVAGSDAASSSRMNWALGAGYGVVGLVLVVWAAPLSVRYNSWTTSMRERHPSLNPPPTPEWRARNTRIMTALFRFVGVFFVLLSILTLLPLVNRRMP